MAGFETTLHELIDELGMEVLFSPLRIQGVLQDDHPNESQKIFATMETLHSGVLEEILERQNPLQEHVQHQLAQLLNQRSGLQMSMALWAIQTWIQAIPKKYFETEKEHKKQNNIDQYEKMWQGSIEEVLGCRMKSE